ncbi:MAG: hypothetical protein WBN49_02985, partial [Arenicellales bacterium]
VILSTGTSSYMIPCRLDNPRWPHTPTAGSRAHFSRILSKYITVLGTHLTGKAICDGTGSAGHPKRP